MSGEHPHPAHPGGASAGEAGPRRPRQQRSRETVERLLAAAEAEIAERGVAATTTRSIAARAGLSVGALYRFFADRDEIVDVLARRYLADVLTPYERTLERAARAGEGGDLGELARTLVRQAELMQSTHPGYYRITEDLPPDESDSPAHQVRVHLVGRFVHVLRARQARQGSGPGALDDEALAAVVGLAVETVRHTLVRAPAEGEPRRRVVGELERMIAAYLTARLGG